VHGRQALADVAAAAAVGRGPRVYEKHDPFAQALHQVVRENLATFYTAIEEGWQTGLPDFVRAEFAGYLDCSVMQRGFAHLACEDCGLPRLVAFTCAGRGFCPTCLGRRMNQTTHNLLAHVLPAQPLRQWVLSLPYALRAPLAYEPGLMGVVARVFADSLLRWYGRRLAPNNGTSQGGLLTVIQRSSGDMRLNPHLHVVALDGLYVAGPDGQPVFRALGHLKTDEVADVVQVVKIRVLKALSRRGVVRDSLDVLEWTTPSRIATLCWRNWRQPPLLGCRPLARPSAGASPWFWPHVVGLRSSGISWCKTAASTCTRRPTRVPSTTKAAPAFCATSCAHRLHRIASPSCLTTASG